MIFSPIHCLELKTEEKRHFCSMVVSLMSLPGDRGSNGVRGPNRRERVAASGAKITLGLKNMDSNQVILSSHVQACPLVRATSVGKG